MANKKDIYAVSDSEFTQAIENSKSYRECLVSLGITTYTNEIRNILKQRIKELNISTSHFELRRYSLEEIFCENSLYSGYGARLINYMIKNNLREYKCEHCGCNGIHNEKSISLQLHHKNGIHTDNRLKNLEILCPSCHSQTDTYGGKNAFGNSLLNVSQEELQDIVINSKNKKEVLEKINIPYESKNILLLNRMINDFNIDISHFRRASSLQNLKHQNLQLSEILVDNYKIKDLQRLIFLLVANNLKEYECEQCHNKGFWNNKHLILQLHHRNGIHTDNRLENLEILCPNCHSQTDTYGGKKNKGKVSDNKKVYTCKMCGANISHGSTFCKSCAGKEYSKIQSIKNNIPPKETLELLLQSKTISEIARQHNVSFNAVKNWIKKYNIAYEPKLHKDLPLEIIEMYKNGQSIKQLAAQLHIDNKRISKFLSDNGVSLRDENKRVIQKDKDGTVIKTWNSEKEAGETLGFKDKSKIGSCANPRPTLFLNLVNYELSRFLPNGKRRSAYGFIWEWVQ